MWYAIILAGGSGSRMGAQRNKVLLPVAGESMLCRSVRAFQPLTDGIVVVVRPCDREEACAQLEKAGLAQHLLFAPRWRYKTGFRMERSLRPASGLRSCAGA